ncbi:hypothetical protein [uncultured Aquimarina sp.]|uniref:hypothetical protein n=1 Tax=uncultured Aquimarina sp. TaxID=575652 RepID=UPI0026040BC7|nr:hypothetical protein [uncultured Aquimarina sp.]
MEKKIYYISFLLLLFAIPASAQCAMCRAVLESEEGQQTARGINNGIVYLMIVPYVLIGVVGYVMYKKKKETSESK